jgi:hypothetical protein
MKKDEIIERIKIRIKKEYTKHKSIDWELIAAKKIYNEFIFNNNKYGICPVCSGTGNVPNGFYNQISGEWSSTSIIPERCRSCDGQGIIIIK